MALWEFVSVVCDTLFYCYICIAMSQVMVIVKVRPSFSSCHNMTGIHRPGGHSLAPE